jgi:hypothetical protein
MPLDKKIGASKIGTFACRISPATPKQAKEPSPPKMSSLIEPK